LTVNGFNFHLDKKVKASSYWKCVRNRTKKCAGRVITDHGNSIIIKFTPHNHPPETINAEILSKRLDCKRLAKETTLKSSQIINKITTSTVTPLLGDLPSNRAMQQMILRTRRPANVGALLEPKTANSFVIPDDFKKLRSK
jgi:hypothetical protein